MAAQRNKTIINTIEELSFVSIIKEFKSDELSLKGRVSIDFELLNFPLEFDVEISLQYPFKSHDSETINFSNSELLEYKHVMGNGMICIHTSHCIDLKEKLNIDFSSLKNWIVKYYINKEENTHYEHLIVPEHTFKNKKCAFIFTEVDYQFKKDAYGFVNLKFLNEGFFKDIKITNFLTESFTNLSGLKLANCKWSSFYKNISNNYHGVYVYIEESPAILNKFIYNDWKSFKSIFKKNFLEFLYGFEKDCINKKHLGEPIPLYIGYKISENEIHWQVALLEIGKFPIRGVKKDQKWSTELIDGKITWGISRNSSYSYFFGRGVFSEKITNKKILIIGTGAIGSIVAHTLTKSGCKNIDLCDYDIKEPENVCRAEFQFANGLTGKVEELRSTLSYISPFVEVESSADQAYFEFISKAFFNESIGRQKLEEYLNSFDIVFDCSTDNDLMYVLNKLDLSCDLINMSITNKAQELVCAFYPNIYDFVIKQFSEVLKQDTEDMYNPTGCWSPTFKASYNDINVLVQYALKHINLKYQDDLPKNNFVIETGSEQEYKLKLKEF
ncbi:ThiF family adenylyltransferase [Tenacibaculum ovolyticum]|uniref:ThiF family adenylyltransferase n=1 Tax=Tenacibaculum ovolyticum TaxID=104270 RepID=UPI0004056A74|nr:ThiF family adenylyltransferase [Tenacibaculum ovolyticum]